MMTRHVSLTIAALLAAGLAEAKTKILYEGQEFRNVTPADLVAHADQFSKMPCDGVMLPMHGTYSDGTPLHYREIAGSRKWEYESFAGQLPDLRKLAKMPCFADTALMSFMQPPKHIDWKDDAGWAVVAHNMGLVARITKEAGLKNNYIDWEDYTGAKQFFCIKGRDPSYDECVKLARQRGREVFGAVYKAHPNLNMIFCWFLSEQRHFYFDGNDPQAECRKMGYLWPAFLNGLLDVIPPTGLVTDINEHGYRFDYRAADAYRDFFRQRGRAAELVAPENRAKFFLQHRFGCNVYPDVLVRGRTEPWYLEPVDGSRVEHFRRNMADMAEVSDNYVVSWGERYPYVVWDRKIPQTPRLTLHHDETWDVRLPGLYDGFAGIRDGEACIDWRIEQLKKKGKLVNLVRDSECKPLRDVKERKFIPGVHSWYRPWQSAKAEQGVFGIDNAVGEGDHSSLCAKGVRSGMLEYRVADVKPGEWYAVKASVKGPCPYLSIEFFEHDYTVQRLAKLRVDLDAPDANGWRHAKKLVKIPLCVDSFQVNMELSQKPDDVTWLDNLSVYRLWPEGD